MGRAGSRGGLQSQRFQRRHAPFAAIRTMRLPTVMRESVRNADEWPRDRMLALNIKRDLDRQAKGIAVSLGRQVDFAKAQALNAVGRLVKAAEQANIKSVFDSPKPFTQNSLGMRSASKANPVVTVFMKDITAKYLAPYETGGLHNLPGKALLNPKDIKLDRYGQLPRTIMARLNARPDIFIGPIKTKSGVVNGVWQRPYVRPNQKIRGRSAVKRGANTTGKLKLLIRFGDALPVKKQLRYGATAKRVVDANLAREFGKAMAQAIATAR